MEIIVSLSLLLLVKKKKTIGVGRVLVMPDKFVCVGR